jgi:small-conductance mechanosensitive channel
MDPQTRNAILTLLGTVIACFLTYRASTRATRVQQQGVDVQQQAADAARTKQLREDLTAAEGEVVKLRRQVAVLTREAESAVADLVYLRRTIWRPGMTVERLRDMVGPEGSPPNGSAN